MARAESSSTVNSSSVSQVRLTKAATSASAMVRRWVRKRNPWRRSSKVKPRPTTGAGSLTPASLLLEALARVLERGLHVLHRGLGAVHHLRPGVGRGALDALHLGQHLVARHLHLVELLQVLILQV